MCLQGNKDIRVGTIICSVRTHRYRHYTSRHTRAARRHPRFALQGNELQLDLQRKNLPLTLSLCQHRHGQRFRGAYQADVASVERDNHLFRDPPTSTLYLCVAVDKCGKRRIHAVGHVAAGHTRPWLRICARKPVGPERHRLYKTHITTAPHTAPTTVHPKSIPSSPGGYAESAGRCAAGRGGNCE